MKKLTVTFLSNYLNHHQLCFSDEMNAFQNVDFYFISTTDIPKSRRELGYNTIERSYNIKGFGSKESFCKAAEIVKNSDVVILGSNSKKYLELLPNDAIIFVISEHFQKYSHFNFVTFLLRILKYRLFYKPLIKRHRNSYLLSASSFAYKDYTEAGLFKNKSFQWGYFPKIESHCSTEKNKEFVWCGRFIDWKHPEYCLTLAKILKKSGIKKTISLIGDGPLLPVIQKKIVSNHLEEYFEVLGSINSSCVQEKLSEHNYILFTSDKQEGWGAVLNEGMGNGCVPIASIKAGSTKFLVNTNNGYVFKNKKEFIKIIEKVIYGTDDFAIKSQEAKKTICNVWNGKIAAHNLLLIINKIINNGNIGELQLNGPGAHIYEKTE